MKKKILIVIVAVIIIILILGIYEYKDVLSQEGNFVYVSYAVIKLNITWNDLVLIPKSHNKYIIKSKLGYEPFIKYKEKQGWKFVEQMGSSLIFDKDGTKATASSNMFTKKYIVIKDFE